MKKFSEILQLSSHIQSIALTATTTAVSLVLLQSTSAQAVNLITNGNFENVSPLGVPSIPSWTSSGGFIGTRFGANDTNVASLGTVGSLGSLSQTISTAVGQNYRLSYDFLSDGQFPNEFQVLIDSNALFDRINIPTQSFATSSFNFVGTGSNTIQFRERNDRGYFQLDNVTVNDVASTTVPEPLTVIGTVIGSGAAFSLRKKLKDAALSNKPLA